MDNDNIEFLEKLMRLRARWDAELDVNTRLAGALKDKGYHTQCGRILAQNTVAATMNEELSKLIDQHPILRPPVPVQTAYRDKARYPDVYAPVDIDTTPRMSK